MARKSGLGKGLGSLIPEVESSEEGSTKELPLKEIHPNPDQPRTEFDADALTELSESIAEVGLIQPVVVRPEGKGYQIIAGERRWQAAKKAGLQSIPVRIMQVDDIETLKLALIENLQRTDLNAIEEAKGYKSLIERTDMTQEELARTVSKSRSTITNSLRLLDLPEEVQNLLFDGKISAGHGRSILALPYPEQRIKLAHRIVEKGLSVRETENLIPLLKSNQETAPVSRAVPRSFKVAARALRDLLDTNVRVKTIKGKNKIEIEFSDEEDLARILDLMGE